MAPDDETDAGPLVLWLPGKGNEPNDNEIILKTAAYAGYRTLGLAFDNMSYTRADWCDVDDNGTLLQGGWCDDGCQFTTGFEMLDGINDASTDYPAHRMRSIRGRLSLALHDLYQRDLVDDGTNGLEWDDFCSYDSVDGTVVHYDKMIVSGFSAGGQMAQFISYVEPVVGLVAIEAGADYCELDASDTSTVGYPDEYDDHITYPPCADAVGGCDPDDRRVAVHRDNPNSTTSCRTSPPTSSRSASTRSTTISTLTWIMGCSPISAVTTCSPPPKTFHQDATPTGQWLLMAA